MLSCQRASWSGHEAGGRRSGAEQSRAEGREQFRGGFRGPVAPVEALTFPGPSWSVDSFLKQTQPWPQGGQECEAQGRASRRGAGDAGRPGAQEDVTAGMKLKSAVTGDSLLPVILKPSASHVWEVLLNTGLLDALWSELISSSLRSV